MNESVEEATEEEWTMWMNDELLHETKYRGRRNYSPVTIEEHGHRPHATLNGIIAGTGHIVRSSTRSKFMFIFVYFFTLFKIIAKPKRNRACWRAVGRVNPSGSGGSGAGSGVSRGRRRRKHSLPMHMKSVWGNNVSWNITIGIGENVGLFR